MVTKINKMKEIKYYTSNHPLFRNGLEINFLVNGLPVIKVDDEIQIFSIRKFFLWLELGYISNEKDKEITIEMITKEVCIYEHVGIDVVFKKTRQRDILEARQIVQFLSKELTGKSLKAIGFETGRKNHATILHSKQVVLNNMDIYPEWVRKIKAIKYRLTS